MKRKKRQEKITRQQEICDKAKMEHRDLSEEEKAEFDQLQREIDTLTAEINADENREAHPPVATSQNENEREGQEEAQRVRQQERTRISAINDLCREFGLEEQMREFIDGGHTVDDVRTAVIEHMREKGAPLATGVTVESDAQDKFRRAAEDAILLRGGIRLDNPAEGARELMGMSLRDLAIECLAEEGQAGMNRRSADELFALLQRQFLNPTAAFPTILDNAINKAYVEGHRTAPVTFDRWVKRGTLKDFKTHDNNYLSGPAGELLEVSEGGELKHDVWSDEKRPTRKLKTYGRQFTLTRQAFINDDIDMIVKMPSKYAVSARKTQNKQAYQKLINNEAIYDGIKLFDKAHKNVMAKGTGITREATQGMIMALSNQQDEFGDACIIRPATIVVPSGYAFDMYTLFYSPTINTEGNTQAVNPLYQYRERIEVVEDPTINILCGGFGNQMPWWLIGAREDTDFIEIDYLNGQDVPNIRRSEVPGVLGYVWDVYLDWGFSVMDYRGAVKNPGVVVKNPIELA
ncbi:MAG: hypothetical protein J6C19_05725 [Lachnospiraceae bacterium]|nr:hypothetical protein [Lachnospiraceae bacterium]